MKKRFESELHLRAFEGAQVDREKGVIFGVAILGQHSANGREYSAEVMRLATTSGLYEGVKAYDNHGWGGRSVVHEMIGTFQNTRYDEAAGKIRGDLKLVSAFKDHLLDLAENFSGVIGFSHDAWMNAEYDKVSGKEIVKAIVSVNSVDLVGEPATNDNMFESKEDTMTIQELLANKEALEAAMANSPMAKELKEAREQVAAMQAEVAAFKAKEAAQQAYRALCQKYNVSPEMAESKSKVLMAVMADEETFKTAVESMTTKTTISHPRNTGTCDPVALCESIAFGG